MQSIVLYLKSEKYDLIGYDLAVPGHGCSGAYRSKGTEFVFKEDDAEAKLLMENCEPRLAFEAVDLTQCSFLKRLQAKFAALNKTPTLVVDGRKYRGLEDIRKFLEERTNEVSAI